jgi:hypothetical protein
MNLTIIYLKIGNLAKNPSPPRKRGSTESLGKHRFPPEFTLVKTEAGMTTGCGPMMKRNFETVSKHISGETKNRVLDDCLLENLNKMQYRLILASLRELQDAAGA